jgi:hypothetical protein
LDNNILDRLKSSTTKNETVKTLEPEPQAQ